MRQVLPGAGGRLLWIGIVLANYLCGLACMTSTSRMMYAFARDGGLPGSGLLKRVSPRWQTPVPAIWTTAALALTSTLYAPAYSTLTTACVIFLYLSYVMPTLVGLRAYGRSWTKFGPFDLGGRAVPDAGGRVGAGRGAAGLDRRPAPQREGADGRAGDERVAARGVVAGCSPQVPRAAGHVGALTPFGLRPSRLLCPRGRPPTCPPARSPPCTAHAALHRARTRTRANAARARTPHAREPRTRADSTPPARPSARSACVLFAARMLQSISKRQRARRKKPTRGPRRGREGRRSIRA